MRPTFGTTSNLQATPGYRYYRVVRAIQGLATVGAWAAWDEQYLLRPMRVLDLRDGHHEKGGDQGHEAQQRSIGQVAEDVFQAGGVVAQVVMARGVP